MSYYIRFMQKKANYFPYYYKTQVKLNSKLKYQNILYLNGCKTSWQPPVKIIHKALHLILNTKHCLNYFVIKIFFPNISINFIWHAYTAELFYTYILFLFVCMWVCCMWHFMSIYKIEVNILSFLSLSSSLFIRQDFSWSLKLIIFARITSQWNPEVHLSLPHSQSKAHLVMSVLFILILKIWTQIFILVCQAPYLLSCHLDLNLWTSYL